MRGSTDQVHVLRLEDVEESTRVSVQRKDSHNGVVDLSQFRVNDASCTKLCDREQILASIEAAFGDHRPFNGWCASCSARNAKPRAAPVRVCARCALGAIRLDQELPRASLESEC